MLSRCMTLVQALHDLDVLAASKPSVLWKLEQLLKDLDKESCAAQGLELMDTQHREMVVKAINLHNAAEVLPAPFYCKPSIVASASGIRVCIAFRSMFSL